MMPMRNADVPNTWWSQRAAVGQHGHDGEAGEAADQEKIMVRAMMLRIIGRVRPRALPPGGAVDRGRLVELPGHRLHRRQVHHHEERRAEPHGHQDDERAQPVSPSQMMRSMPRCSSSQLKAPNDGSNSSRQPSTLMAAGITHGTRSMPRHLRWPLVGRLCTKWAAASP